MLKDSRNLLWFVPLAALLTFPLWKPLAADFLNPVRQEVTNSVSSLTNIRDLNSSDMADVEFEQNKNGSREWLLTASRLTRSEGDPDLRFENVKAVFFSSTEGREEARVKSRNAVYNPDTQKITLKGKVVINNNAGYEMQTDAIEYLAAEKKIRTTSAVNILGNNIKVSGNRLVYDTITGNYSLNGNVVCRIW
ncbi:MAG: LPS export ABC transporter periplasmic protein LptC [Deltaproteobacteria bacterium]|jgi:LPS export ABC transporter protein LptC|nr:LPS export ABC transporter periplasmic protein LptC [Deltaproteobacteria bacterium]